MTLDDIRSAIADVERSMKKARNKIEYREKVIRETEVEVVGLRREYEELVDRYADLVAQEQKIVRPGSVEDA